MARLPFEEALEARQRRFYAEAGSRAFEGTVPFRLSTSEAMARALWAAADAFRRATGATRVRLVDLGAGTGRLVWATLRHAAAAGVPCRGVLTDASGAMLEAWRAHPQLRALEASGAVELRQVDARDAGALSPVLACAPAEALVLVGTYLLDTLPNALVSGTPEAPSRGLLDDGGALSFEAWPEATPFVRAQLRHGGPRFLPVGGFGLVRALEAAAPGPALLVLGDKGPLDAPSAVEGPTLRVARHGDGHSVAVNFEALAAWLGWRGWAVLPGNTPDFVVGATLLRRGGLTLAPVAQALAGREHPLAAQAAVTALRELPPERLHHALLTLEPGPDALLELADDLRRVVGELPPEARAAVCRWAWASLEATFWNRGDDVAFHVGTVLQRAGALEAATLAYGESLSREGPSVAAHFNRALCFLGLGQPAKDDLEAVLRLDPAHPRAAALLHG